MGQKCLHQQLKAFPRDHPEVFRDDTGPKHSCTSDPALFSKRREGTIVALCKQITHCSLHPVVFPPEPNAASPSSPPPPPPAQGFSPPSFVLSEAERAHVSSLGKSYFRLYDILAGLPSIPGQFIAVLLGEFQLSCFPLGKRRTAQFSIHSRNRVVQAKLHSGEPPFFLAHRIK